MIDLILGLHLYSLHLPEREWQNNVNPGLYVRSAEGWTAGFYRNTLRRQSLYLGKTIPLTEWADLTLGGVSGYERRWVKCDRPNFEGCYLGMGSGKIKPLIAPSLHYEGIRLSWIPGTAGSSNVLHLSIERSFH